MADGLVHLERHLLGVDDDGRDPRGAGVGREERSRLLADTRRLRVESEALHELPARLGARAAVGARKAPVLDTPVVRDGQRVDAAAALDGVLRHARTFGGAEDAQLAHRANGGLRDLHLGSPHALLGPKAERDLLLERHLHWVAPHGRGVLARGGRDGGQLDTRVRARGAGAGEGDRPDGGVACPLLGEPRVGGEAPRAADEDADADPLGLGVRDRVDLAVLRRHELRAALDDSGVRVACASGESGVDRVSGDVQQAAGTLLRPVSRAGR